MVLSPWSECLEHPGPFFLDVRVSPQENCYPMIPAGAGHHTVMLADGVVHEEPAREPDPGGPAGARAGSDPARRRGGAPIGQVVERSVSRPLELTGRRWRMPMLLDRCGPSTSGQFAASGPLDPSQVSRVSCELAGKGPISMSADPQDRRKQTLAPTPAGIDPLRRGVVQSQERQRRFRECPDPQDCAAIDRALDVLIIEARRMLDEGA